MTTESLQRPTPLFDEVDAVWPSMEQSAALLGLPRVTNAGAIDGPGPLARESDPVTSHAAADSISVEALEESEAFVMITLRERGIATMPQLEQWAFGEWSGSRIRTAVKQLVEKGLVRKVDDEGITPRGRACGRFEVVR